MNNHIRTFFFCLSLFFPPFFSLVLNGPLDNNSLARRSRRMNEKRSAIFERSLQVYEDKSFCLGYYIRVLFQGARARTREIFLFFYDKEEEEEETDYSSHSSRPVIQGVMRRPN